MTGTYRRLALLLCLLTSLVLTFASSARDPRVGDVSPVPPAEKVERVLNGTLGFPPSPTVPWTPDESGFDSHRLFHVPAAGIHPRILFGPEDLPRIRKECRDSHAATAMHAFLRTQIAKGIDTPTTWEGRCYAALLAENIPGFIAAFHENPADNVPPGSGFKLDVPGRESATHWGSKNPLLASLEAKALLALLDDDANAGRQVAKVLTSYARFAGPKVDAANALPWHEYYYNSTRAYVAHEIAFAYDWSWPWMTPAQRDTVRSLIARAAAGKYTLGMDLPSHWRRWNFIGLSASYGLCLLAIEGEPGDDPRGRDRIFEVCRDYLTYGTDALGMGTEGIGYHTAGVAHIAPLQIAFANRGKNLLTHPHWRRLVDTWLVQSLQPFGGNWQACGDLANFPPSPDLLIVQKYFYPDSPGVNFVFRNQPQFAAGNWAKIAAECEEPSLLLATDPLPKDFREAAQRAAADRAGDGLTYHDSERGCLYTRTGWGSNDLTLHVDCRMDTPYPSHDHPDRGQFTLAALGRAWACDGYRDSESKYHNLVTIDGRGQGFFAAPGRWIAAEDTPRATTAIVDAKYCWDWMWAKSCFTESRLSLERRHQPQFVESAERLQQRFPLDAWEPDPLPQVTAYYQGFADRAHGDPRMWNDEDSWQLRTPWYPVKKAFRSVTLSRGKHPYVLVMDDIRKDDAEHLYEWRMNAGPEVCAVSLDGNDILLGDETTHRQRAKNDRAFQGKTDLAPAPGDRLLLVRTLEIATPDLPTLQPPPLVATIEYKKTDDSHQFFGRSMGLGTQVVIGSRSVEPRFVILLFPHRQGEEWPVTTWNESHTRLTLAWKNEVDQYSVGETQEGCRTLTLVE